MDSAADVLRKSTNASENYKVTMPILFVKRLNDNFIEKAEEMIKKQKLSKKEAYENKRRHTFFVPENGKYLKLQKAASDVGDKMNKVFREIERENPKLEGVLVNAEFNNKDKYTEAINERNWAYKVYQSSIHFSKIHNDSK